MSGNFAMGADLESAEDPVHDQLPSVAEYKAHMPRGSSISMSGNAATVSTENHDDDDDLIHVHDQLPSLEEAKSAAPRRKVNGGWCHYLAIFLGLVFVTLLIVVPIVVIDNGPAQTAESNQNLSPEVKARRDEVIRYLADVGISSEAEMKTPGSPQQRAVLWLSVVDGYDIEIPASLKKHSEFVERYSLAVLYFATNGDAWSKNVRFLDPTHHCDWNREFVSASGTTLLFGVTGCEDSQPDQESEGGRTATEIQLDVISMVGTLPEEIQFVPQLQKLNFAWNPRLVGSLPSSMQTLSTLTDLQVQYCAFTGKIPDWIGSLTALEKLGLGNNKFEGAIPGSLFQLPSLWLLGLDDNFMLEGNIQDFASLSALRYLYLEGNALTGQLTDAMLDSWPDLEEIDVSLNLIDSTLPSTLFSREKLTIVDLSANLFRSTIPDVPAANNQLIFLALHDNKLTGTIPPSISSLRNMLHLDLSKNQLVSPLPDQLGDFDNIGYLFIGENSFSPGKIPDSISRLTKLFELSMKNSALTGTIPTGIGGLSLLQVLDLDRNNLSGQVPSEIGKLTSLDHLLLNRNQLTGSLPDTFSNLVDLDLILLDQNSFSGSVDFICDASRRSSLLGFSADCDGSVPELTCKCCNICCDDGNESCNDLEWDVNLDPIWEYGFTRQIYAFGQEQVEP